MTEFNYIIKDENGIHARPAGMLVKAAAAFKSSVKIKKGEKTADGKKLFGLMGLAVKGGDAITVLCDGEDENEAAVALEKFFSENL